MNKTDGPTRFVRIHALLLLPALCAASPAIGRNATGRADGRNVLVLYAANGADRDGNGTADSEDVARYYARRRGVPAENLLGLKRTGEQARRDNWPYADVVEQILKPVAKWLATKGADGTAPAERICYIAVCPGLPTATTPLPKPATGEKRWYRKIRRRSVDSYLVSVDDNARIGVDPETGFVPETNGRAVGQGAPDLVLPIYRTFGPSPACRDFRTLRREGKVNFYLVTRLGDSPAAARDMLDGALYAERHLRLPAPGEKAAIRPAIWLDMKYQFAGDHVLAMSRAVAVAQGAVKGTPFTGREGLTRRWPLVIDTAPAQIGQGSPAHRPTVTAKIAPGGVDEGGITLDGPRRLGRRGRDVPPALYFPIGCKIACYKPEPSKPTASTTQTAPATEPAPPEPVAAATVLRIDTAANRLVLNSTKGFEPGYTVKYVWAGSFPTRDCFLFYGFYGLGQFEDVREFPPGAIGVHVDSSCMRWAKGAMSRGIGATFGVTTEPLSIGIPHGDAMLVALGSGYDWAESVYGSLRLAQRWTGVAFGDPLYAPFRSKQLRDTTPPAIGPVTVKTHGTAATLHAELADATDEQAADVALFRLDYGPTADYGRTVDFQDWPDPDSGKSVQGRRFGYSRQFLRTLKGLEKGKPVHYRLTARDPAGLETRTADATFTP